MTEPHDPGRGAPAAEFAREAEGRQAGFLAELWAMLAQNKKWWLTPIVLALVLASLFVVLGSSAVAPLIYTIF